MTLPPREPPPKCQGVHVWTHEFGDDWSPERGTPCDCGRRRYGWEKYEYALAGIDYPSEPREPPTTIETAEDEAWHSEFGAELFNLYTERRTGIQLFFSARKRVTMAMLRAMLQAEQMEKDRHSND